LKLKYKFSLAKPAIVNGHVTKVQKQQPHTVERSIYKYWWQVRKIKTCTLQL